MNATTPAYSIGPIPEGGFRYLAWASARGYDGEILKHCSDCVETDAGWMIYFESEADAWQVQGYVEDDPDAFLACCGCPETATACWEFLDSIV